MSSCMGVVCKTTGCQFFSSTLWRQKKWSVLQYISFHCSLFLSKNKSLIKMNAESLSEKPVAPSHWEENPSEIYVNTANHSIHCFLGSNCFFGNVSFLFLWIVQETKGPHTRTICMNRFVLKRICGIQQFLYLEFCLWCQWNSWAVQIL